MGDAPTPASRRLRVFLCHPSGDKPAVRALYARLKGDGFEPWLDEEDLIGGQDWQVEIPRAVRSAHIVLVCLSSRSVNKQGYVQKEIKVALDVAEEKPEGTIFLIPLKLEECSVPERLTRWHWVSYFQSNGHPKLLRALSLGAESLGLNATLPTSVPAISSGTAQVSPKDGLEYVWIPPGAFSMGATPADKEPYDDEKPRHPVRISRGFWLGKTPVTVGAYRRFAGATGCGMPVAPEFNGNWKDGEHPIVNVSWHDAQAYCEWSGGRLPSEAEWEYAARGGKEGLQYPWGNEIGPDRANYQTEGTTPVLKFPAQNDWGLRDMAGNVWEWVADWYDEKYYSTFPLDKPVEDPKGPDAGSRRVLRGGAWYVGPGDLRAADRGWLGPDNRVSGIGFRCAREVPSP